MNEGKLMRILCDLGCENISIKEAFTEILALSELVAKTADAYCPHCEAYIVNERVTYEGCCDNCGTEIEWRE